MRRINLDNPNGTASALEAANATGEAVDLAGATVALDRRAILTRAPRFVGGTIKGEMVIPDGDARHEDCAELRDLNLEGGSIWAHRRMSYDRVIIDGLTLRGVERLQIDGTFAKGGCVRRFEATNTHSDDGKCFALGFGYNNTKDQDLPPILIESPWINGVSSNAATEVHAIISIAQPIRVLGGYIANVSGVGTDGAEGIYTKSSRCLIQGVAMRDAGTGEAFIALKGGDSQGSIVSGCSLVSTANPPRCAVWVQSHGCLVMGNIMEGFDGATHKQVYVSGGSTGNFIGCGQVIA